MCHSERSEESRSFTAFRMTVDGRRNNHNGNIIFQRGIGMKKAGTCFVPEGKGSCIFCGSPASELPQTCPGATKINSEAKSPISRVNTGIGGVK